MQRCPAFVILLIYISAILHQKFYHFQIIIDACLKISNMRTYEIYFGFGMQMGPEPAKEPTYTVDRCVRNSIAISVDEMNK